ncbi:hypothetical protein BH10BAC5_BH10BAC5_07110 [soil metagenome]
MKILRTTLVLSSLFLISIISYSQSFTKITNQPPSQDSLASRSANWIDYDNDGLLDLFVSNGPSSGAFPFLYHNDGNGIFSRITTTPINLISMKADGSSWGDYNNDGFNDLCVVTWYNQNDFLFQNNGAGNFTFQNSNIISNSPGYSETCSWGDYNNDGLLDLMVTNSAGTGHRNFLYKNIGGGNFQKQDTGIVVSETGSSRGISWIDIDNDGDLDLFICNEEGQTNFLYKNNGDGSFTKITNTPLTQTGGNWWSASWGDYNNDGYPDVFMANWGGKNALYKNNGNWNFTVVLNDTIVGDIGQNAITGWGDFDNDGDLDMYVTQSYGTGPHDNILYKNMKIETGTASFQRVNAGEVTSDGGWTYGFSWGDYDRDGDLDIFCAKTFQTVGVENEKNALFRNNNSNGNKWIEFKTVGMTSNKSGIGAKIKVKAIINGQTVWQVREVDGQSGYCTQNLEQHFGLGNATIIDSVRIEWPSGMVDNYSNVTVNKFYKAVEGQTSLVGINDNGSVVKNFTLYQNYPNPFNPETKISFELQSNANVSIRVYNSAGILIKDLLKENKPAGFHEVSFNAKDLASGIYFYKLEGVSGDGKAFSDEKKMALVK